jgi:hypothetical protein
MLDQKVKLNGGLEKTATWIWLDQNDRLKVEFYDFSETAQRMFGNDIAYTITVDEMDILFSAAKQDASSVIGWMAQSFQSYFGIKRWLEEHEIGFSIERESWA